MLVSDFDFDLPDTLIAQTPASPRDHSKLMIVNRAEGSIGHDYFYNLPQYLQQNDVLVFNDTKVIPVRLYGKKETGGNVEILLLEHKDGLWKFIGKNIGRARTLLFEKELEADVVSGGFLRFNVDYGTLMGLLFEIGFTPLPPYIASSKNKDDEQRVRAAYQTVYAAKDGSAAAPTAGLHFTTELLAKIPHKEYVTLQVGLGTFLPLKNNIVEKNVLHTERYDVGNFHKPVGKKIVAVGTTTVRVLESWANTGERSGETNIFIYPGHTFRVVDHLITNFHLPKSSLLMLVCAFAGKDLVLRAYHEAVQKQYRFFSYGDAMLIL